MPSSKRLILKVESSLSQVELNKTQDSHTTPWASIDVFRVRHHSSLPVVWSKIIRKIKSNLNCLPNVNVFTILKPIHSIKALFLLGRRPAPFSGCGLGAGSRTRDDHHIVPPSNHQAIYVVQSSILYIFQNATISVI